VEVALFVLLMASGQLLFKATANSFPVSSKANPNLFWAIQDWRFIAAIVLYGAATLLWIRILKTMPLSTAYPLAMGATITVTALIGVGAFNETLGITKATGLTLLVSGLFLLGR
jgi:multidrug transporter EmrE-like cation transporter